MPDVPFTILTTHRDGVVLVNYRQGLVLRLKEGDVLRLDPMLLSVDDLTVMNEDIQGREALARVFPGEPIDIGRRHPR